MSDRRLTADIANARLAERISIAERPRFGDIEWAVFPVVGFVHGGDGCSWRFATRRNR